MKTIFFKTAILALLMMFSVSCKNSDDHELERTGGSSDATNDNNVDTTARPIDSIGVEQGSGMNAEKREDGTTATPP